MIISAKYPLAVTRAFFVLLAFLDVDVARPIPRAPPVMAMTLPRRLGVVVIS
jgi:hypothetical protein